MYRMVIVDDLPQERKYIKEIIDWKDMDIEIAGIFSNGRQVVDRIDELQPHIILSDIRMPVMSGIEMARELANTHPKVKIIFMSFHNDFSFAKSAIELDICGYVLKPVDPEDLKSCIRKVLILLETEKIEQNEKMRMMNQLKSSLPMVQEQFIKELLLGNFIDLKDIDSWMEFLQLDVKQYANVRAISVNISGGRMETGNLSVMDKYLISYTLKEIMNSYVGNMVKIYTVQISNNEFAAIVLSKDLQSRENVHDQECVFDILGDMVNLHSKISKKLNLSPTIGVSRPSNKISDISRLYEQALKAVNTKFYNGKNPIIMYDEIDDTRYASFETNINFQTLFNEVKLLITYVEESEIISFLDKYLGKSNCIYPESYIRSFCFTVINMVQIIIAESGKSFKDIFDDEMVLWEKLSRFDTIQNIYRWMINVFRCIKESVEDRNISGNEKIVNTIKEIIAKRYSEPITLNDISREVYLSSGYCNVLFKKETGVTIYEYLMEYRIEMAKKLLKDINSKVANVSELVGYNNTSYFCLIFKRITGLTPAEYKNRMAV